MNYQKVNFEDLISPINVISFERFVPVCDLVSPVPLERRLYAFEAKVNATPNIILLASPTDGPGLILMSVSAEKSFILHRMCSTKHLFQRDPVTNKFELIKTVYSDIILPVSSTQTKSNPHESLDFTFVNNSINKWIIPDDRNYLTYNVVTLLDNTEQASKEFWFKSTEKTMPVVLPKFDLYLGQA